MPYYDYVCPFCGTTRTIKKGFEEASDPVRCETGPHLMMRLYEPVAYSMPGKSNTDSWNDWIDGREAAVGMTRERTQQLAQHAYREGKKADSQPVAPRKSVSTPGNPSPHQKLPD